MVEGQARMGDFRFVARDLVQLAQFMLVSGALRKKSLQQLPVPTGYCQLTLRLLTWIGSNSSNNTVSDKQTFAAIALTHEASFVGFGFQRHSQRMLGLNPRLGIFSETGLPGHGDVDQELANEELTQCHLSVQYP